MEGFSASVVIYCLAAIAITSVQRIKMLARHPRVLMFQPLC